MPDAPAILPARGQVVRVRHRQYLVEDVEPAATAADSPLVRVLRKGLLTARLRHGGRRRPILTRGARGTTSKTCTPGSPGPTAPPSPTYSPPTGSRMRCGPRASTGATKVFTPLVTLWAFLTQVAHPDRCCRAAVTRVAAWLVGCGRPARATTGGYCKARARIPEGVPRRLTREVGRCLHRHSDGLWRGRRVKVADGTTISMPDTAANQRAYPQPDAQKPGLGFPILRAVVVFCLATGSVLDAALGRYHGKRTGRADVRGRLREGARVDRRRARAGLGGAG